MSTQKPDKPRHEVSEREARLLAALDDSVQSGSDQGLSADLVTQLQQRRQAALKQSAAPKLNKAQTGRPTISVLSWWQEGLAFAGAFAIGIPKQAVGAMALVMLVAGLWLTKFQTQEPAVVALSEPSSEAVFQHRKTVASLEEWLLLTSVSEQDWELVENAEFLAWLEEQEAGHPDVDQAS